MLIFCGFIFILFDFLFNDMLFYFIILFDFLN